MNQGEEVEFVESTDAGEVREIRIKLETSVKSPISLPRYACALIEGHQFAYYRYVEKHIALFSWRLEAISIGSVFLHGEQHVLLKESGQLLRRYSDLCLFDPSHV